MLTKRTSDLAGPAALVFEKTKGQGISEVITLGRFISGFVILRLVILRLVILWRETANEIATQYPEVTLDHLYVDNAAMQMVKRPDSFDVLVTENLFGDILSDEMAMISGSLGMLPSASLGEVKDNGLYFGMYEPSGGSAPDIAGQGIANPIAQILSVSMMLRYSLGETIAADAIDTAAQNAIDLGLRTGDLFTEKNGETRVNTIEMGNAILKAL
ncbi:isocitrate/isopropylmalate family dehydrogenase [Akkermansiaceae bacterium]|nr:isocitrate/isopropylmalate family dehydrogenase [Akkermansiaceae bacterium]